MDAVEAVLVAEVRIGPVSRVRPLAGQRWLVQRALGELVVLDERLTPSWRLELPTGRPGIVAVADDLSLVAVSRAGQLVLLDGSGRQLASVLATPSGSSAGIFTADGAYLWVVLPGLGSETPTPASQEVWLLDVATRSLLDRCRVGLFVDDRPPIRHPDGRTVGLSLWVDGRAAIGWAVAERGRITFACVRGAISSWPTCGRPGRSTSPSPGPRALCGRSPECMAGRMCCCAFAWVMTGRSAHWWCRPRRTAMMSGIPSLATWPMT